MLKDVLLAAFQLLRPFYKLPWLRATFGHIWTVSGHGGGWHSCHHHSYRHQGGTRLVRGTRLESEKWWLRSMAISVRRFDFTRFSNLWWQDLVFQSSATRTNKMPWCKATFKSLGVCEAHVAVGVWDLWEPWSSIGSGKSKVSGALVAPKLDMGLEGYGSLMQRNKNPTWEVELSKSLSKRFHMHDIINQTKSHTFNHKIPLPIKPHSMLHY